MQHVTIGSDPTRADVVIDQKTVSGLHCRLTRGQGGELWLEDLHSTNGTTLNGVAVPAGERRHIDRGSRLGLGRHVEITVDDQLLSRLGPAPQRPTPAAPAPRPAPVAAPQPTPAPVMQPVPMVQAAPMMQAAAVDPRAVQIASSTSTWLSLLGIVMLLNGIAIGLTIVGLVVAWLPMWMGLLLLGASGAGKRLAQTGNPEELVVYLRKTSTYFTILGVILALSLLAVILMMATVGFSVGAVLAALSDM